MALTFSLRLTRAQIKPRWGRGVGEGHIDNFLKFPPTAQLITEGTPKRITWQNPWYPACLTPMGKLMG